MAHGLGFALDSQQNIKYVQNNEYHVSAVAKIYAWES